ncbi:hypothetical protein GCM10009678_40720 [Actinomadura kijaniata]|uniref:Uncharacterized protein n=1 Tax=Actinomadura namibiensis TaxID=182080 RepID=A0A7W3LLY6_ACTNM|nr:hypothetical protein [Actinomadura namibiensis]MBA8950596.1 hypothetical protein [Actinomadura namibiensis]
MAERSAAPASRLTGPLILAFGLVGVAVFLGAYARVAWDVVEHGPSVRRPWPLPAAGVCAVALAVFVDGPWGTLPGLFAGMLALAVAPRAAVPLAVLVIGAVVVSDLVRDAVAGDVVELAARNVFAALTVFALGWLNLLHRELWLARGRLAEADATGERLRAARDRGEALARALSAIGLRGGPAARLLADGRLVHGPGPDRTYLLEAFVPLP